MKKIIFIFTAAFTCMSSSILVSAQKEQAQEISITHKAVDHLSMWYRIKHAFQSSLERAFNTKKQLKDIIRHGNVVIKFYRPGCTYCNYIDPILEQVKSKYAKDVTFVSINLNEQSMDYKRTYEFESVPSLIYFKDGKELFRHGSNEGSITQKEIEQNIKRVFFSPLQNCIQGRAVAKKSKAVEGALSSEERSCLELLITLAESNATQLAEQLHTFFDTDGNKETFKAHVSKFHDLLMNVDKAIMAPLKKAINKTENAECKKMLKLVQKLVAELRTNLDEVHGVLNKHIGKKSIELAQALGKFKDKVEARAPELEKTLKELFVLLKSLDQKLAQKVEKIQKSLATQFEMKMSNLILLSRLNKRMGMR